jgi:hypothetical protein
VTPKPRKPTRKALTVLRYLRVAISSAQFYASRDDERWLEAHAHLNRALSLLSELARSLKQTKERR